LDGNFRLGQWLVQPQLNLIQGSGGATCVEPKAMEVLVFHNRLEVVSKERLMQTVWADTFVTDEVLTNSIWELLEPGFSYPSTSRRGNSLVYSQDRNDR